MVPPGVSVPVVMGVVRLRSRSVAVKHVVAMMPHVHVLFKLAGRQDMSEGAVFGNGVVDKTEVDVKDFAALAVGEPELHGHAVGHQPCLSVGVPAAHCISSDGYRHQQCYHHVLFHNRYVLKGLTFENVSSLFLMQRYSERTARAKVFS